MRQRSPLLSSPKSNRSSSLHAPPRPYGQRRSCEGCRSARMMNLCSFRQSAVPVRDVVCPKPRRVGPFVPAAVGDSYVFGPFSFRFDTGLPPETSKSKAETEVLDLILARGDSVAEESNSDAAPSSPPPFFWGSPPSRASNPLTQDARFKSDVPPPAATPPSTSAAAACGPIRMKVGHKPPPVRIEGFDCLGRDGQNRSIYAFA